MFFLKVLVFISLILLIQPGRAALQCQSVFKQNTPMERTLFLSAELDQAQRHLLSNSTTLKEANEQVHQMVVTSNELLDNAIKAITTLNVEDIPSEQKASLQGVAEVSIEKLQQSFGIDDLVMKNAITHRIDSLIQERQALLAQEKKKRAIGFNRDESSARFHSDPPDPEPIGFALGKNEALENSIEQAVLYVEDSTTETDQRQPAGFVKPEESPSVDGEPPLDGIGFLPLKEPALGELEVHDLNQISFNETRGEFELITATTMGF